MRRAGLLFFRAVINALSAAGFEPVGGGGNPLLKGVYDWAYDSFRPRGVCTVETAVGPLLVDLDRRGAAPRLLLTGNYDPEVSNVLRRVLRPGAVFVDVGANIGFHTALARQLVGKDGAVVAFEPDSANFSLLSANVETSVPGLADVELHREALDSRNGVVRLFKDSRSNTRSSIAFNVPRKVSASEVVPCRQLDDWATESDGTERRIDVLKVDAEGADLRVLVGAQGLLARSRPILILEVWPYGLSQCGGSAAELAELLDDLCYRAWVIGREGAALSDTPLKSLEDIAVSRSSTGRGHVNVLLKAVCEGPLSLDSPVNIG